MVQLKFTLCNPGQDDVFPMRQRVYSSLPSTALCDIWGKFQLKEINGFLKKKKPEASENQALNERQCKKRKKVIPCKSLLPVPPVHTRTCKINGMVHTSPLPPPSRAK